ncbi:uncharacterized protein [Choristoneura fumiferana]|uniref:uncharacterized protein n=1 Tax=Choristoneura fumiferana TaxID=7141 RepID=UPI003D1575C9
MKQINLSVLLEDAKQIAECPWYLNKSDVKNETLKVTVNEDLCNLLCDYMQLEGNAKAGYSLRSAAELGDDVEIPPPPPVPVYPPEIPKDVRQKNNNNQKLDNSRNLTRQGLRTPGRFQFTSKRRSFEARRARSRLSIL